MFTKDERLPDRLEYRDTKYFGQVVAAEMERRGLSVRKGAAHCGIPKSNLHDLMIGKTRPSLESIELIAAWFGRVNGNEDEWLRRLALAAVGLD